MTLVRPSLSELIERIETDLSAYLPGADTRLRRSPLAVLARVQAGAADGMHGALAFLARQLMPDTAEAAYLDRWATIWGVTRKAASVASGSVALTGVTGAIVPAGAELARADGARFVATARVVLGDAGALLPVEAAVPGVAGVTPVAATLTFTSPVSGVVAIATAALGLSGGADEEADAALLARLLLRIRQPPQGGSSADWVGWALEVPAVTRAWCYPGWMGPGTVGLAVVCDGRADILPLQADLDAVAAYIETVRPVTAAPVIFAPQPYSVDLLVTLAPGGQAVRDAVTAELADLFAREAEPGGTIYLSRINEAISVAAGEYDHRVRAPADNVVAPTGFMPILGTVAWT